MPDAQSGPAAALSVLDDCWRLALLPVGLWWSPWIELLGPCHPPVRHDPAPEDEGQLIVPEPIEADGEHALFA